MSQEKVDRYKADKANRKKIMRKQKIMGVVRKLILSFAAFLLIGWLGFSAYQTYDAGKDRLVAEVNYDAVNNYLNGLE